MAGPARPVNEIYRFGRRFEPPGPAGQPRQAFDGHLCAMSDVYNDEEEFKIRLDVQYFMPDEMSVIVKEDRLIVHAMHFQRNDSPDDDTVISREFFRSYVLPLTVNTKSITAVYDSHVDILLIRGKKSLSIERRVQISGPVWKELEEEVKELQPSDVALAWLQGKDDTSSAGSSAEDLYGAGGVTIDDHILRIHVDVSNFTLEQLRVLLKGNTLFIEVDDQAFAANPPRPRKAACLRRFKLPRAVDPNTISAIYHTEQRTLQIVGFILRHPSEGLYVPVKVIWD